MEKQKIKYHIFMYGKILNKFKGHTDDRGLYVNIYNMILEALESLPEEPTIFIKVAINKQIENDYNTLDAILQNFE